MKAQEVFDMAVRGVIAQGKPAVRDTANVCCYRDATGTLKCAVGQVIPDNLYTPLFEEFGDDLIVVLDHLATLGLDLTEYRSLLRDLQVAHDNAAVNNTRKVNPDFVQDFRIAARKVAHYHRLDSSATFEPAAS